MFGARNRRAPRAPFDERYQQPAAPDALGRETCFTDDVAFFSVKGVHRLEHCLQIRYRDVASHKGRGHARKLLVRKNRRGCVRHSFEPEAESPRGNRRLLSRRWRRYFTALRLKRIHLAFKPPPFDLVAKLPEIAARLIPLSGFHEGGSLNGRYSCKKRAKNKPGRADADTERSACGRCPEDVPSLHVRPPFSSD